MSIRSYQRNEFRTKTLTSKISTVVARETSIDRVCSIHHVPSCARERLKLESQRARVGSFAPELRRLPSSSVRWISLIDMLLVDCTEIEQKWLLLRICDLRRRLTMVTHFRYLRARAR